MATANIGPTCRRTPDHPPYALMIGVAIKTLADEGGSTEESISAFIKSNYVDIPPAHDFLLPYYLHKLTARAEFSLSSLGRYFLPEPEPDKGLPLACEDDVVIMDVPVRRKRGRPPKNKVIGPAESDVVMAVPVETVSVGPAEVARRGRGRPPKCKSTALAKKII